MQITVYHTAPEAGPHVAAVRAALTDGRLALEPWSISAGVSALTVRAWLADEPIQNSFEARLWAAAVTTTIPGWATPSGAVRPTALTW
jgi:hypothetical protein